MGKTKKRASTATRATSSRATAPRKSTASARAAKPADGGLLDHIQKRLPADLAKQVEKSLAQSQKALVTNVTKLQAQLKASASKADVDKLTKRIDAFTKQVEKALAGLGAPAPAKPAVRRTAAAKTTTRRSTTAKAAAKPAAKASTARSTAKPAASAKAAAAKPAARKAAAKPAAKRSTARTATKSEPMGATPVAASAGAENSVKAG